MKILGRVSLLLCLWAAFSHTAAAADSAVVCVSNERDGTVTLIDGRTFEVTGTINVGKRPRGIHASPDNKWLYVAVSGTPIAGPPKKDASGKVIRDDDDE